MSHDPLPDETRAGLPRPAERSMEARISRLLRIGVGSSFFLVLAGMAITFLHHPGYLSSSRALRRLTAPATTPHSLAEVLASTLAIRGQGIVMAGILILIATPVLRVALSLALFRQQRDTAYVVITAVVLALLLLSFALGRAGG